MTNVGFTKVCIDCGEAKSLDRFYAKPDAKDKRSPYCKDCQKARSIYARDRRRERDWRG